MLSFRQGHPIVEQENLEPGSVSSLVIFFGYELFLCFISWEVVHAEYVTFVDSSMAQIQEQKRGVVSITTVI